MTFWLIVLGICAGLILLGYRHDRKRRGRLRSDIGHQVLKAEGQNEWKGVDAAGGHNPLRGFSWPGR